MLGHSDQPNLPHPSPPPPPPTSSCKRKSPYQLCCHDRRKKEAASRIEETANDLVKETSAKPSEKNTKNEAHVTEKLPESEKNYLHDQNNDSDHEIQPMQATVSFQCDQCKFMGVSDKGIKQHKSTKHKLFQVDGNIAESEDKDSIQFTF